MTRELEYCRARGFAFKTKTERELPIALSRDYIFKEKNYYSIKIIIWIYFYYVY